jgi:opacity protein-like surface antigen
MDVSVGVEGDLTITRMPTSTYVYGSSGAEFTQVTQSAAPSAGAFASFHQSFKPWLGYNVHFGYTRFTEHYSNANQFNSSLGIPVGSSFIRGDIRSNVYDLTVSSVFEGPRTKRFSTFAEAGGGGLFFTPLSATTAVMGTGLGNQTRPALVFGAGANIKLRPRLDLRAEYRGLFYKSPDFGLTDIQPGTSPGLFPMTRLFTVTSTPEVSLVYHFGRTAPEKVKAKRD